VEARLIGVIEAEQTEDGETERNARLIAVADHSITHEKIESLDDLDETLWLGYRRRLAPVLSQDCHTKVIAADARLGRPFPCRDA
jgi:hypothetical protein